VAGYGAAIRLTVKFSVNGAVESDICIDRVTITAPHSPEPAASPLRRKGEAYSVDTTVTGSNEWTSDDPKFALVRYFRECVFKQIAALVAPGGVFEGYTPVIQGDQAGPHEEEGFKRFVAQVCNEKGWLWEPQAPQMPHLNVDDLAVFPAMSKRHSDETRKYTGSVASKEVIWNAAAKVWAELPACLIARGFILAWRLAEVVIQKGGENTFLGTKEMHRGVSADFNDTQNGVTRSLLFGRGNHSLVVS
jgi:hypothetical protein